MKHVRMIIRLDGTCSVDAINFTGPACQTATLKIASVLSGDLRRQCEKPEARLRERSTLSEREAAR